MTIEVSPRPSGTAETVAVGDRKNIIAVATPADASAGTWTMFGGDAAHPVGALKNGAVQNDYLQWSMLLTAGTYDVTILGSAFTDRAILTLTFDGVSKGTADFYNTPSGIIKQITITGCVVPASGVVAVRLAALTKNASSSSYQVWLGSVTFKRTA